jgi:hypothetical protein
MKLNLCAGTVVLATAIAGNTWSLVAQEKPGTPAAPAVVTTVTTVTTSSSPHELAKAALSALGGEKYLGMKTLILKGTADLYAPNQTQALPAQFVLVTAGDRTRLEIQSPIFSFRQISDGERTYSSVPGFESPAPTKFGLPVLKKFEQSTYKVTALPDRKKLRAFRVTDADGLYTDFYVDPQTARVMSFESVYNGLKFGVEHKTLKMVDGVLVPFTFVQSFATSQGDYAAEFKVKEAKVNQEVADDVFQIPQQ